MARRHIYSLVPSCVYAYCEGLVVVARISVFVDWVGRDELAEWIVCRLTGRYVPSERVTL